MKTMRALVGVVAVCGGAIAGTVPPKPEAANLPPSYPERAKDDEIEGQAVYRLRVSTDGTVADAKVTQVPAEGYGFEDSVLAAVRTWRFSPATTDGAPHEATVRGALRFSLDDGMSRARMFDLPADAVWSAVEKVASGFAGKASVVSPPEGIWISRWLDLGKEPLPARTLDDGTSLHAVRFHLFVPPGRFPGRVYVGTEVRGSGDPREATSYNDPVLARWMLDRIEEAAGSDGRRLPPSGPERDAAIARWIGDRARMPSCVPVLPPPPGSDVRMPEVLPATRRSPRTGWGLDGEVRIAAIVNEDGVPERAAVESADVPEGPPREAALRVFSLWRFRPASVDGCPGAAPYRVAVRYRTTMDMSVDEE